MKGFQYNELEILKKLFPDFNYGYPVERNLYVVEVGAADGIDNSNSYELIQEYQWRGLLVEPHPGYFMDLLMLYTDHPKVKLSNYAIGSKDCRRMLGLDGQCSSLVHKKPFEIQVQCVTLTNLLKLYNVPNHFNFLSVDCEGADMEVLRSLDWTMYKPAVVCVEHSMSRIELDDFMNQVGYKEFANNMGNTFFVRK